MTEEESRLIDGLEERIQRLIGLYEDQKALNASLQQELAAKNARVQELEGTISGLQSEYGNLKSSKVLSVSGQDLEETRKKVQGMVREIDRCLGMLNV